MFVYYEPRQSYKFNFNVHNREWLVHFIHGARSFITWCDQQLISINWSLRAYTLSNWWLCLCSWSFPHFHSSCRLQSIYSPPFWLMGSLCQYIIRQLHQSQLFTLLEKCSLAIQFSQLGRFPRPFSFFPRSDSCFASGISTSVSNFTDIVFQDKNIFIPRFSKSEKLERSNHVWGHAILLKRSTSRWRTCSPTPAFHYRFVQAGNKYSATTQSQSAAKPKALTLYW